MFLRTMVVLFVTLMATTAQAKELIENEHFEVVDTKATSEPEIIEYLLHSLLSF